MLFTSCDQKQCSIVIVTICNKKIGACKFRISFKTKWCTMATGKDGMSIVDIIRRSMGEGFNTSKRKGDEIDSNNERNKKPHLRKNLIEIKLDSDFSLHTDDNYFQTFDGSLRIKEEPPEVMDDEDSFENNGMSIKEEVLSPIPDDDEEPECQSTWKTENMVAAIKNEAGKEKGADQLEEVDIISLDQIEEDIEDSEDVNSTEVAKSPKVGPSAFPDQKQKDKDYIKIPPDSPNKPYELNITFLQALYLHCHEDGIMFVEKLQTDYLADLKIESKGVIRISEGRFKKKIMKHLHDIKVISIPTRWQNLGNYLDVVLQELAKPCTIQDLKELLHKLKNSGENRHASYQTINMKIYGYYQWEYGQKCINILKNVPRVTSDAIVDKSIINSIEESLRYLIENERPSKLYCDIIESISSQKSNFLDTSIYATNLLKTVTKNKLLRKIIVDDLKYDYFINSLTSKFMIARWRSKLKVSIEEIGDETILCLEGSEANVEAAHEEFRVHVAEGPMLPFGILHVYSFVTFLLDKITSIQRCSDSFNADKVLSDIIELEKGPQSVKSNRRIKYIYEDLHTYIFATRGLQQGKEKLIVLHEFISKYKSSLMRDNLKQNEWKMVQDAFVVLQYKKCNRVSNYRYFLKCLNSMKHTEDIILTIEEYNILSETLAGKSIIEVLGKLVDFDVAFSRIFSSKHATLTIIGSESGILICKRKLYEFLDRVIIRECNIVDLENKLNNALENLWTTPITKEDARVVLNRIEMITARNESYMIETLRELYMQMHIYLFGRCRLLHCQNHVSKLKVYYQYVKCEKNTTPEILNDIISSYEMIFGKNRKIDLDYKHLMDISSNNMAEYNLRRDTKTVCICDSVVRAHFYNNPVARNLMKNYIDEAKLCKFVPLVKQFANNKLIFFSSGSENEQILPIIIKSESVRIFSEKRSKIIEVLTVSLQAIAEVKENMTHSKATEIFKAIQHLERNSVISSLIEEKYQVLNIYLFGCCGFDGGREQFEVLRDNHSRMTESQDDDDFITDKETRANLVNAYEFIFWKGKRDSIDYDFLLHKAGVVSENNVHTLPMPNRMYSYLTNVKEGITLLEECANSVKIKIQQDLVNKTCSATIEGDENEVEKVIYMLINEIKCIKVYLRIPYDKESLITYLKKNLKNLLTFDALEIPVHILQDLEILDRLMQTSMSETDCLRMLALRSSYYIKLHKYIFGVFEKQESAKHINILKNYVVELENDKSERHLDLNIIKTIHNTINNYLFSVSKITTFNYKSILKMCIKSKNKMNIHFTLSKNMSDYLNNCNDGTESTKLLKEHLETITNTITINAFEENVDKLRDFIDEYTLILENIPMQRDDLIKLIKTLFNRISDSKCRDPTTIWASLHLCKKQDSRFAIDRLPLSYSRLHTYLFGYRQLLDGKQLVQCLGQHEYNLEVIGKPEDVVSIQVLRDVNLAFQYIEGTEDKGVDYKTLISKNRKKIVMESRISRPSDIPTRNFIICSEVNAPQRQRDYLENTGTGRALLNSIQKSSVHIKFDSDFLKLRGTDTNVKIATERVNDYFLMVSTLPVQEHQLQCAIASYMRKLYSNKVDIGHIASLYTEIFKMELQNIDSSRKVNKTLLNGSYHSLHINLFGSLRLLDGERHVNFLKRYNEGKIFLSESDRRKLYEAYDYVFGSTKKDLDYSVIIRDLCGNRCFYVSKAHERLLDIQNRTKKGKDPFIGPSSLSSIDTWISAIKEEMFNDDIMIAVHKFLNKYEDVRDNKKEIVLI